MKASLVCGILSAVIVGALSVEPTQTYKPWGQVYKPYVAPFNWTIVTKPGDPRPPAIITKPSDYSFVTRPPLVPTTTVQTPRPYGQQVFKPLELSRPIGEVSKPSLVTRPPGQPQPSQTWTFVIQPSAQQPQPSQPWGQTTQTSAQQPQPSQPWGQTTQTTVQQPQPSQPWGQTTQKPVQQPLPSQPWGQTTQTSVQQPQPSQPWGQTTQKPVQQPLPSQPWGQTTQTSVQQPQPSQPWGQTTQKPVQQPQPSQPWIQVSQPQVQQPQLTQPWGEVSKPVELPVQKPLEELKPYGEQKPQQYGEQSKPDIEQRQPFEQSKPLEPQQPNREQPIKPVQQLPSYVEPSKPLQQQPSYVEPIKPLEPQQSYGEQPKPYGEQPKPYGEQPKPYGEQPQHYGEQPKPYGEQNKPLEQPLSRPIGEPLIPNEQKPLEQSKPWGEVSKPLEQNKTLEQYTTTELPKPYGEVSQLPVQSSQPAGELSKPVVTSNNWIVGNKPVSQPQPLGLGYQNPQISSLPQTTLYLPQTTTPIPYTPYSYNLQPYWGIKPFQAPQSCNYQINEQTVSAFRHAVYNMSTPLYKRAAALTEGHFVFSPFTIWLTMAAIAEGASEPEQSQLFKLLGLPLDNCVRQAFYHIGTNREHAGNDIVLARNRLFVADSSIRVNKQWEDFVQSQIDLKTVSVPFKQNPAAEIEALKKVLKAHLPNINLNGNSLLLESLDYHGLWTSAFTDAVVQEGPFYNSFGQQIGVVEYMKTVRPANIGIIASLNLKIIDLPVGKDGRYRMYFAVPLSASENYVRNFDLIENSLMIEAIASLKPSLEPVEIVIPKMAMTSELDVRQLFEDIGVKTLWTNPQATRNISEPAAVPSAFNQRVTVTIDDGGLRPAIQEYHNYVPPLHHAQVYSKPVSSYPNAPGPWSNSPQFKPAESHFIANKPFMFGLFDAKTLVGCFTASFSKVQH